ncbi:MAG: hypothetical protein ACKON8_14135, partial [Planctomycetota bacterium]
LDDAFVAAGKGRFRVRPEHADRLLAGIDFLGALAKADDPLAAPGPWAEQADRLVIELAALIAESVPPAVEPPPAGAAVAAAPAEPPPRPGPARRPHVRGSATRPGGWIGSSAGRRTA